MIDVAGGFGDPTGAPGVDRLEVGGAARLHNPRGVDQDVGAVTKPGERRPIVKVARDRLDGEIAPERIDRITACEDPDAEALGVQRGDQRATEEARGPGHRGEGPGQTCASWRKAPARKSARALERLSLPDEVWGRA